MSSTSFCLGNKKHVYLLFRVCLLWLVKKKKSTEALLYVLSSTAFFFSLSFLVNVSSKRTPTFVVSLLLFLSALFPLSSLSQVFCIHGHTHTHTNTQEHPYEQNSLFHLFISLCVSFFSPSLVGLLGQSLHHFSQHTHYHLARLLFYSYTLRQTRYRYY